MHKLEFHPSVKEDFISAANYYKQVSPQQLDKFKDSLKEAYSALKRKPAHYLILVKRRNIRRNRTEGI